MGDRWRSRRLLLYLLLTLLCLQSANPPRVHRKLLKIFKILGRSHPQLKLLPTYLYKNILLFLSDLDDDWSEAGLPDR